MRPPHAAPFRGLFGPLPRLARLAWVALLIRGGSSLAATPVDPGLQDQLRAAPPGAQIVAGGLSLEDGTPLRLELTRFEVFAPGARIEEHGAGGSVRPVPIPDDRYFRGTVSGDPDSLVVLTAGRDAVRGLVSTRGEVFTVARGEPSLRASGASGPAELSRLGADGSGAGGGFRCGNDAVPGGLLRAAASGGGSGQAAPLSTTTFDVKVALETDYELYQLFGSSVTLSSYLASLVATASAIYLRDINTTISIPSISLWSTPSDPWSATDPTTALLEVGDYWQANRPKASYPRSTVHFIGHKGPLAGRAWIGVLCSSDFNAGGGHFGGAYGVTLGALGQFSTSNTSLYWDILAFTHEVGHNFNSPHTHCYSPPVDHCRSGEGSGCYSGSESVPPEKGTIMSYCHLVPPGFSNNIVFFLGKPAEASQAVTALMRSYVESVSACLTPAPASTPLRLYTVTPCRLADTRGTAGPLGGPALGAASTRVFGLAGVCGVPSGAKALSLNVTVTQPGAAGNIRLYPGDGALPGTSSLNFATGQTRANNVVIPVSADGLARVAVRNDCPGSAHLILDVNGYFQ